MRPALELIVRPFVVSPVTNTKQPVSTGAPTTQENAVLDIGSGSVTQWSGNFDQMVSYYYVKKPKEKKSQTQAQIDNAYWATQLDSSGDPLP
jgi:hypothetical protein